MVINSVFSPEELKMLSFANNFLLPLLPLLFLLLFLPVAFLTGLELAM